MTPSPHFHPPAIAALFAAFPREFILALAGLERFGIGAAFRGLCAGVIATPVFKPNNRAS